MPASTTIFNVRIRKCGHGYLFQLFLSVCVFLAIFSYMKKNIGQDTKEQSVDLTFNNWYKQSVSQSVHEHGNKNGIQEMGIKDNNNIMETKQRDNKKKLQYKNKNMQKKNIEKSNENNLHTFTEDGGHKYELSFGHVPWEVTKLKGWFQEFNRSVAVLNNTNGMRLAHQFALYTVLRERNPKYVIESGVWRGRTTKVIRKTLPESHIISIDPMCVHKNSSNHEVYCGKAFKDFKQLGERWRTLDKENTVIIFDDHQSGFLRTLQSIEFGFKYIMIEDNYEYGSGDNYSPKQVLTRVKANEILFLDNFGRKNITISRAEHNNNHQLFKQAVSAYIEFPPLDKQKTVEWRCKKDKRTSRIHYVSQIIPEGLGIDVPFDMEHLHYRNMCYLELNANTDEIRANIASVRFPK